MESRKSFEQYIKPSLKATVFGILVMIAGGGAFALELINHRASFGVIWLAFGLGIGSLLIVYDSLKTKKFKKTLEQFEKNGDIDDIMYDFENGRKMFNGALILGQYFLISKKSGTVVEYSEVDKLYQLVKGTGERAKRIIQIRTTDKKKINLCKIPVSGSKTSEELGKVLGYITAKNRNISL